jgi:phosphoenolpyruvate-protein phosphotransferase
MKPILDFLNGVVFQGVSGSPGLTSGPAFRWQKKQIDIPRRDEQVPELEQNRLTQAVQTACIQIRELVEQMVAGGHAAEAEVFGAHIQLVQDKGLHRRVQNALSSGLNAEVIWNEAIETYAKQLESMRDPTFSLRAADLRDVGERVLYILLNIPIEVAILTQPSIIIAHDLTPSETISMKKEYVLGFCTAAGGPTSHTAILAKGLCLPAVVSLGNDLLEIPTNTLLLVDGSNGQVIAAPDKETQTAFAARSMQALGLSREELASAHEAAVTRDGKAFEIVANVGGVDDSKAALNHGAEGVGLFRTEFVFLERSSSPNEEEQFACYQEVLEVMDQRPVIIRTLDAGGDKELTYLNLPVEANPFLGERAIRLCLSQPDLFKQQLRALLRAGTGHNLRIMFPMIATLQELRQAKALLEEAKKEVLENGHSLPANLKVGIMIEIPATAILSDHFASEVDFFSIGTNDLTQYSMAADRTNPKVAYLNDHCHPAVLHLIAKTTQSAHDAGIWVGVCGEMAGDSDAIPLLVGLGIDEFSMSPGLIPHAKSLIRSLTVEQAAVLARSALSQDSASDVREMVRQHNWEK